MTKECNGYFGICRYKGVPVCSLNLTFLDGKQEEQRLCEPCAKHYAEQYPETKHDIESAIIARKAITMLLKDNKLGLSEKVIK